MKKTDILKRAVDAAYHHAKMINSQSRERKFTQQELDKAMEEEREERTEELRLAFHETFFKSGELWFDYLFEDGDTEAEQDAREIVEEYWKELLSKLKE